MSQTIFLFVFSTFFLSKLQTLKEVRVKDRLFREGNTNFFFSLKNKYTAMNDSRGTSENDVLTGSELGGFTNT